MSVTGVTNTNSTANTPAQQTVPGGALDENSFLNLLMTELQNQDPDNTVDDTQFISELAQFSSLQETTNVSSDMSNVQAVGMIGKTVTYPDPSDPTSGSTVSGPVTSVTFTSNGPSLAVTNSTGGTDKVALTSVTGVQ